MNSDIPYFEFTSVNGTYMNSGSNYAPNIEQIKMNQISTNYFEIEDRNENNYPPIGQLIPIGDDYILIIYSIIYIFIKKLQRFGHSPFN